MPSLVVFGTFETYEALIPLDLLQHVNVPNYFIHFQWMPSILIHFAIFYYFFHRMIWRKLKTMTSVCKYTLASSFSSTTGTEGPELPTVMTSEGTGSDIATSNKTIEDTINISQQDVEAVLAEEEQELVSKNMEQNRPESSRREDFDFYF